MAKPISFGKIAVNLGTEPVDAASRAEPGMPFRVALLGNFSGRASRGEPLAKRQPVLVDRDNFDAVLTGLDVELPLLQGEQPGSSTVLHFTELEDFHPNRLVQRVPLLQHLRSLRDRLSDPATFAAAAAELRPGVSPAASAPPPEQQPNPETPVDPANLLDQILGESPTRPAESRPLPGGGDWQQFLQKTVEPHRVARTDPRQEELVSQVEEAIGAQLRGLLHDRAFQALEAAWRAVHFLVRRLDTDGDLKLYLLDVARDELAADLQASDDVRATGTYRLLAEPNDGAPGRQPWAVVAGAYTFDQTPEDVQLLGRLARICRAAGAPFLAAASERVLGCASLARTPDPDDWVSLDAESQARWQALRLLPDAAYLGLALPRFLLRLPYGKDTNPTEQIAFEEMPAVPIHEDYLWGNPAFACAYLLAEAFNRHGWDLRPGMVDVIDGLPLHTYEEEGETRTKPCAEVILSARAAERILGAGLMPFLSLPNREAIELARFQALAEPAQALAGRWR